MRTNPTYSRPAVKSRPRRVSPLSDCPFAFGLGLPAEPVARYTPHAVSPWGGDDDDWREAYVSGNDAELDAAWHREADRRAMEAEWERMYELGVTADERCGACFGQGPLTAGLCAACATALELDREVGTCLICDARETDIDATGLCPVCASLAEDASVACANWAGGGAYRCW